MKQSQGKRKTKKELVIINVNNTNQTAKPVCRLYKLIPKLH